MDERSNAEDEELGIEVNCGILETWMETFLPWPLNKSENACNWSFTYSKTGAGEISSSSKLESVKLIVGTVVKISPHYRSRNGSLVPIWHKDRFLLFENRKKRNEKWHKQSSELNLANLSKTKQMEHCKLNLRANEENKGEEMKHCWTPLHIVG